MPCHAIVMVSLRISASILPFEITPVIIRHNNQTTVNYFIPMAIMLNYTSILFTREQPLPASDRIFTGFFDVFITDFRQLPQSFFNHGIACDQIFEDIVTF